MNRSFERRLAAVERRSSGTAPEILAVTVVGGFGQMGFASAAGSHVLRRAPRETLEAFSARAVGMAETANERVVVIQGWSPEMDGLDEDDWRAACAEHAPLPAPPVPGIEGLSTAAIDPA